MKLDVSGKQCRTEIYNVNCVNHIYYLKYESYIMCYLQTISLVNLLKLNFHKRSRKIVHPRHRLTQKQLVIVPETPLEKYLCLYRAMKAHGTKSGPATKRLIQGQRHLRGVSKGKKHNLTFTWKEYVGFCTSEVGSKYFPYSLGSVKLHAILVPAGVQLPITIASIIVGRTVQDNCFNGIRSHSVSYHAF